jgi:hypothetical protein
MMIQCGACGQTIPIPASAAVEAPALGAATYADASVSQNAKLAGLSSSYVIDINEWFQYAKAHYNAVFGPMIGYLLIYLAINIVLELIPIVGPLVGIFLDPPLLAGFVIVSLAQLKGRPWTFGDFFGGFHWYGQLLGNVLLVLVMTLGMLLPGAIVLGIAGATESEPVIAVAALVAFVNLCAAIYVLTRATCFCTPLIIDRGFGPVEAIKGSWIISRGHFWGLFGVQMLFVAMSLGGILLCGVGILFVAPFVVLAEIAGYLLIAGSQRPIMPTPTASSSA